MTGPADMQYEDAFVKMLDVDRFEIRVRSGPAFDDKSLAVFKAVEKEPASSFAGADNLRHSFSEGCRFCVMRRNCSVGRMCGICCGRRK